MTIDPTKLAAVPMALWERLYRDTKAYWAGPGLGSQVMATLREIDAALNPPQLRGGES